MRIGIDCRFYGVQAGIGRYIRNLIFQLQTLDKTNDYFLFLRKQDYDSLTLTKNFQKAPADFPWYGISEQVRMPGLLKKYNLDLVHFPHFNVPVLYSGKFVVTIHDLTHQYFQMRRVTGHNPLVYRFKQMGYKGVFKRAITGASKIITPSAYVKQLLNKSWNIAEDKIVVTPEGVEKNTFKSRSSGILNKLGINNPFLFYVGNAYPHKNLETLIKVFLQLNHKYKQLKLVLSGDDQFFWPRIRSEYQNSAILYTGYITDEELGALYKNAVAFVMPSLEEGFGIPLLEAMSCLCPVISSSAGSLPEVAGEAAMYFNPKDPADMFAKIEKVLNSERLRQQLIKKGLERIKLFSWERLGRLTLEVYEKCALP